MPTINQEDRERPDLPDLPNLVGRDLVEGKGDVTAGPTGGLVQGMHEFRQHRLIHTHALEDFLDRVVIRTAQRVQPTLGVGCPARCVAS